MKTIDFQSAQGSTDSTSGQKIGFIDYLYVLMLMLYASRANKFFESPVITENPIGVMIPVIFSAIMAFRWKLFFTVRFYMLLFFFAIYFLAVSIKYYTIQPTFLLTYYLLFFITYTAVRTLKFNLFLIYEYLLFTFAVISLFFWSIQIALGGDTLYNIFGRSSFLQDVSFVSGEGVSILIYSIQTLETNLINNFSIARNAGYAWEPGSYGVYLSIGIFINLFMVKNDPAKKKRLYVLILALLTTLSTTGYALLSLILVFYFINKEFRRIFLLLPVLAAGFIFLFSLPFMKDKIVDLVNETRTYNYIIEDSYHRENSTTPQRFTSLIITLIDFKNNPVLGIAAHSEAQWTHKIGSRISPISGIGNLLAQFGLAGFLFFVIALAKSSFLFARYFKYRGKWFLFLLIFGVSISYTLIFIPFVMAFWTFGFFEPELADEQYPINEIKQPAV
jgi:hypothetical protein